MSHDGVDDSSADVNLLPNSLTIAGLQHIIDNLCKDVHESMAHWSDYFAELKCFEALLRVEELGPFTLVVSLSLSMSFRLPASRCTPISLQDPFPFVWCSGGPAPSTANVLSPSELRDTLGSNRTAEERRQRYVWTCLLHSRFASCEKLFSKFSGSLYEDRWHEVVSDSPCIGPPAGSDPEPVWLVYRSSRASDIRTQF
jgi:hypothetical protein